MPLHAQIRSGANRLPRVLPYLRSCMNAELRELMSRARLTDELLEDGVNVALPINACEMDMLAYVNSTTVSCRMLSVPIRVASFPSPSLQKTLEATRATGVLIVLVWGARPSLN